MSDFNLPDLGATSTGPIVSNATATATPAPAVSNDNDNILDILSPAVGAAAGVSINYALASLSNQQINDPVLILSAGVGSVIGTGLHTFLSNETLSQMVVVNSIVGAAGAMTGCAAGLMINNGYVQSKEATSLPGVLLTAGFSALGAGAAIGIKQMLTKQPELAW